MKRKKMRSEVGKLINPIQKKDLHTLVKKNIQNARKTDLGIKQCNMQFSVLRVVEKGSPSV